MARILRHLLCVALVAATGSQICYAASQTETREIEDLPLATLEVSKPAENFSDADIMIPSGFSLRGIDTCTGRFPEPASCPLRKHRIRVDVLINSKSMGASEDFLRPLDAVNDVWLSERLSDILSGIRRFEVLSRYGSNSIEPDVVLRVQAFMNSMYNYKGTYGEAKYELLLSSAFMDPMTGVIRHKPRIPQIPVSTQPMAYWVVGNRVVRGLDFSKRAVVEALYHKLLTRAFVGAVNALINEMPSRAQVLAIRNNYVTLDRGSLSRIIDGETMIVFQDLTSVLEPLAVMTVSLGEDRSHGEIKRWKSSKSAEEVKKRAAGLGFEAAGSSIFAVSVGAPPGYRY